MAKPKNTTSQQTENQTEDFSLVPTNIRPIVNVCLLGDDVNHLRKMALALAGVNGFQSPAAAPHFAKTIQEKGRNIDVRYWYGKIDDGEKSYKKMIKNSDAVLFLYGDKSSYDNIWEINSNTRAMGHYDSSQGILQGKRLPLFLVGDKTDREVPPAEAKQKAQGVSAVFKTVNIEQNINVNELSTDIINKIIPKFIPKHNTRVNFEKDLQTRKFELEEGIRKNYSGCLGFIVRFFDGNVKAKKLAGVDELLDKVYTSPESTVPTLIQEARATHTKLDSSFFGRSETTKLLDRYARDITENSLAP